VRKWRVRFLGGRMGALTDAPPTTVKQPALIPHNQRAGRAGVPVFRDPQPGPDRDSTHPVDDALEARDQPFAITFGDRWPAAETY
jgi:hypothetical protein